MNELEKKRFEKTNQEVIQQNVQLHSQLRASQKTNQEARQEIVELKVCVRQLEVENERLSLELEIIKREIGERAPTLHLISKHVKELGEYLRHAAQSSVISSRYDENYPDTTNDTTKPNKITSKTGSLLKTIFEDNEN